MSLRRQPGDTTQVGETFLACCYAVVGLSWLVRAALKFTDRSIAAAVRLPAERVAR